MPPGPTPLFDASRWRLLMTLDMCAAWSLALSIFVFFTMLCSFSSWLSISKFVRICRRSMASR